jgi:hypothetical protein
MMNSGKPVNLLICDDHLLLGGWPHLSRRGFPFIVGARHKIGGKGGVRRSKVLCEFEELSL